MTLGGQAFVKKGGTVFERDRQGDAPSVKDR